MTGLYGSTYGDLLDSIEDQICSILARCKAGDQIIEDEYSGSV